LLSQLFAVTVFTTESSAINGCFAEIPQRSVVLASLRLLLLLPPQSHLYRRHVTFAAESNVPRYTGGTPILAFLIITSLVADPSNNLSATPDLRLLFPLLPLGQFNHAEARRLR